MEKPINRGVSSQNPMPESIQGKASVESGLKTQQVKSSTSRSKHADTFRQDDLGKGSVGERSKMKRPLTDPVRPEAQRLKLPKPNQAPVAVVSSKENKQEVVSPLERFEPSKLVEGSKEFAEMATKLQEHLWGPKRRSTEEFMKYAGPQIDAFFESPEADAKIERMDKDVRESLKRGSVPIRKNE
jgi:hypothetical protein